MTEKSLIFTKGGLQTLDYFAERMCVAAKEADLAYTVADVSQPLGEQEFTGWLQSGKDCITVMFNNVALMTKAGDENLWEHYGVPVCNFLVDHPRAFSRYLRNPIQNLHVFCVDRNHVRFIERFYPGVQAHFLPHGGNAPLRSLPYGERPIDVLYVGSCQKEPQLYHIDYLSDQGQSFYRSVIPALMQDYTLTCEEAIRRYLEQSGLSGETEAERRLNEECADTCERYVRRRIKKNLLRALAEAGVSVEVYGENWTDEGEDYGPHVQVHERVSAAECMELMGQAKIAFNIMPWFKDGSHERVYNAMLSGALCVTDESVYLKESLSDGENAVFYDRNDPGNLAERLKELLAKPEEAMRIAENGRHHAAQHDLWDMRLKAVLETVSVSNL